MRVMPDHIKVIAVLVIPRMAAFDVVDFGLQRRFLGSVVRLHRHQLRVIRRIGGAGNGRTDALRHHGAGGHGVEQQADEKKNRAYKQKAFFMAHNKCSGLLCLFLNGFCSLAGSFGSSSGGVSGALGGGVFLFDGLFLLPAGNGVAGKLGIFPQRLLIQGVHIGLFQLLLRLCRLAVRFQLVAAVALPNKPNAGLCGFLRLVGALHAHIVLFRFTDFLVEFSQRRISRSIPDRMGQLGGRFFLVLQHQFGGHFAGLRVHRFLPHLLFGDFRLRPVCFGGGPVCLVDGLFQRRVSAFLVCKVQARFLTHTSHPPSGHPAAHRFPHIPESEWFLPERPLWTGKSPSGFLLPCPDPESGCQ